MKKKTPKKKTNDLLYLIIFVALYTLISCLDSCYIYGTKALISIIFKNSLYTFLIISFVYIYHYKKKNKKMLKVEKFFVTIFFLCFILFLNIRSINCFYGLLMDTTSITTDKYYVYSTTGYRKPKKYYLYLNTRKESVRINRELYNTLDNNDEVIEVIYYHNTEVLNSIKFIK